jgi:hypothetical protein
MDMASQLLNVRVPRELYEDMRHYSRGFGNVQEFTRQSLREKVDRMRMNEAVLQIEALRGSQKGKARIASKKELSLFAKKFLENI